jgi:ATP synthase F1 complex assembly factor 1
MLLSQWQSKAFLMTFLEDYRQNPSTAQPWMCVSVYDDLQQSHDLHLLRTDFTQHLTKQEAHFVQRMVVLSYTCPGQSSFAAAFNRAPATFDLDRYLEMCRGIAKNEPS